MTKFHGWRCPAAFARAYQENTPEGNAIGRRIDLGSVLRAVKSEWQLGPALWPAESERPADWETKVWALEPEFVAWTCGGPSPRNTNLGACESVWRKMGAPESLCGSSVKVSNRFAIPGWHQFGWKIIVRLCKMRFLLTMQFCTSTSRTPCVLVT